MTTSEAMLRSVHGDKLMEEMLAPYKAGLESLQKENDLLRQHIVGESWQQTINERDQLRAEVAALKHDVLAYRAALGYSAPEDHDGKLSNGETPQCGMCNSEHRKNLERDKERLDWALTGVLRLPTFSIDDGAFNGYVILYERSAIDAAMRENKP